MELNGTRIAIMKTCTATPHLSARVAEGTAQNNEIMRPIRALLHRIHGLLAALGNWMRLIRAYNELHRLNDNTLQDIGFRRGELDRVLNGHRPSSTR